MLIPVRAQLQPCPRSRCPPDSPAAVMADRRNSTARHVHQRSLALRNWGSGTNRPPGRELLTEPICAVRAFFGQVAIGLVVAGCWPTSRSYPPNANAFSGQLPVSRFRLAERAHAHGPESGHPQ